MIGGVTIPYILCVYPSQLGSSQRLDLPFLIEYIIHPVSTIYCFPGFIHARHQNCSQPVAVRVPCYFDLEALAVLLPWQYP